MRGFQREIDGLEVKLKNKRSSSVLQKKISSLETALARQKRHSVSLAEEVVVLQADLDSSKAQLKDRCWDLDQLREFLQAARTVSELQGSAAPVCALTSLPSGKATPSITGFKQKVPGLPERPIGSPKVHGLHVRLWVRHRLVSR